MKTACCQRELPEFTPGAWERDDHTHAWGTCWNHPACCNPSKALWIRQECVCMAIQWVRRDSLPPGDSLSLAKPEEFMIMDSCWCGPGGRRHKRHGPNCGIEVTS